MGVNNIQDLPAALLWDMDGTLVDSEPQWGIATYEMSEAIGRRLTPELREETVGGSFENTIAICQRHAGVTLSAKGIAAYRRQMFARVQELLATEGRFVDGVEEVLDQCHQLDVPCAVVTNTPRELALPLINHLGAQHFEFVVCGDDVARGKPDPMIYQHAASLLGAEPEECLALEDSTTGMTAALAAGCVTLASPLATQPRPEGVIEYPRPLYVGTQFKELAALWKNAKREKL